MFLLGWFGIRNHTTCLPYLNRFTSYWHSRRRYVIILSLNISPWTNRGPYIFTSPSLFFLYDSERQECLSKGFLHREPNRPKPHDRTLRVRFTHRICFHDVNHRISTYIKQKTVKNEILPEIPTSSTHKSISSLRFGTKVTTFPLKNSTTFDQPPCDREIVRITVVLLMLNITSLGFPSNKPQVFTKPVTSSLTLWFQPSLT